MKKIVMISVCFILLACLVQPVFAGDATPEDVIAKVKEAAVVVAKGGEGALAQFNDPKGHWVWGGTYVFVMKCEPAPTLVTHPVSPGLIGKDLSGLKDKTGNYFFIQLCDAAKAPKGGWVEYLWPKPGEKTPSRKISFCMSVPGTDYQVGAGLYDENVSLEKLNAMIQ